MGRNPAVVRRPTDLEPGEEEQEGEADETEDPDGLVELDPADRWRLRTLLEGGYLDGDALKLAMAGDVDLHAAASLIRRGCPSALGVQILL